MKRKKNYFRNLFRCFKPVKNRGTIGILQRTLVISNWTFLLLVIISVILEIVRSSNNNWINFFETYAIGSACSIVIVIITTIIQFTSIRNEKANRFAKYLTNISEQLFIVKTECDSTNGQGTDSFVDYLKKVVNDCTYNFEELYWFDGEIDDLYSELAIKTLRLGIHLDSDPAYAYNLNSQEVKEYILNSNRLICIINPNGLNFLDGIVGRIDNGILDH